MAEDNNKLMFEIDLDSGQVVSKLNGITQEINNFAKSGESGISRLGGKFLELNAVLEVGIKTFEAAHKIFEVVIMKSVEAAIENEHAFAQMNLGLANAGLYSKETSENMNHLAESLSKTTTFSGEAILNAETLALKFAKTEEQAKALTKASIDMAAATGTDVNTAIQRLGLSLNGTSSGLERLDPRLKNLTKAQLANGEAVRILSEKYSGSASAMAQTFGGRVQMLKNQFNELQETIGKSISQSPIVNRAIEGITIIINKLVGEIQKWASSGGMEAVLKGLLNFSFAVTNYMVKPLEYVYNFGKIVFDLLVASINGMLAVIAKVGLAINDYMVSPFLSLMEMAGKVISFFDKDFGNSITATFENIKTKINEFANTASESTEQVFKDSADDMGESIRTAFDTPISDKMSMKLEEIREFFNKAKEPINDFSSLVKQGIEKPTYDVGEAFKDTFKGMDDAAADFANNASKNMKQAGASMFQSLGSGAANAFAAFGKAVVTGKNALAEFGKAIFQAMGQMAVQLGSQFILMGTAALFAPIVGAAMGITNPVGLIATGAGLATLGGILMGLSGGGEAPAAGGSSGGGGGYSGGGSYEPTAQAALPESKKQASIVINGDFLNSRETANHLAEIVRQNSDITDYSITAQGRSYA